MRLYSFLILLIFSGCVYNVKRKPLEEDLYTLYLLYSYRLEQGRTEKALNTLETLVDAYPEHKGYLKELITLLYGLKDFPAVIKYSGIYFERFSYNPEILTYALASSVVLNNRDTYLSLREKFIKAVEDPKSLIYIVTLDRNFENHKSALTLLDSLIRIDSSEVFIQEKGKLLISMEKYNEGISLLESLPESLKTFSTLVEIGKAYEEIEQKESAYNSYRLALLYRDDNLIQMKLIQLALELGQYDEAESLIGKLIYKNPFSGILRREMGFIKYQKKEYISAIKDFLFSLEVQPKDDLSHYYLSRVYYRIKNLEKAFEHIQKAIEINPKSSEYYGYQAFLYLSTGKEMRAFSILRKAYRRFPENATINYLLGFAFRQMGKEKRALRFYEKSVKIDPEDPQKWFELGMLYEGMGKIDEAEISFERATTLDTTFASAYNYWGYMLAERGYKLEFAQKLIEKALKYDPTNGYYIDSMGWVYYKQGKYDEALQYLEQAVSLAEDDPVILEHLGDVYHKLGNKEQAKKNWGKAYKLDPKNKSLQKKVAQ